MKKKIIALTLIFAMLVPFVPAAAAEETAARPTVEEILSQYHQAAFEAQMSGGVATASTNSRSGSSGQTMEQQTVDTLNEAGYEAYSVTADNCDTLEEQLQTDFSGMGLDPEGSYIVVIHGEEQPQNGNARLGDLILPPHPWEDDNGGMPGSFSYVYNGNRYYLRYVTVTPDANESGMQVKSSYIFYEQNLAQHIGSNIFNTIIASTVDETSPKYLPFGTLASFFLDVPENYIFADLDIDELEFRAHTVWTYNFIQVWDSAEQTWVTSQLSEYTTSGVWCIDSAYNSDTGMPVPLPPDPQYTSHHSSIYYDTEERCLAAMKAYDHYTISVNCVDKVEFFWAEKEETVVFDNTLERLFVHYRSTSITLPETD